MSLILSVKRILKKCFKLICAIFTKFQVDISALFTPRQPPMSATEAQQLSDDWNEDLEVPLF